jgi:carbonic anhydrase
MKRHVSMAWLPRGLAVVLGSFVLAGCGGDSGDEAAVMPEAPAWNHNAKNRILGPANWGNIDESFEQCLTGTGQSPVDIAATVPAELPPLEFSYTATPLVVENTGHVIEVPMPEDSDHTLTIEDDEYRLVQYHFHAPSEHTLQRVAYDIEAHLVHENDAGELAVVGVFLDEADSPSLLLDSVMTNAPEEAGEEVDVEEEWNPLALLPVEGSNVVVTRYYTYPGSLTTPGCTEGVRWVVLKDTLGVSTKATERLHELISGFPGYDGYENNNRPTQPLNDRVIESSED